MDVKYDTPTLLYASVMDNALKSLKNRFNINFFHFARRIKNAAPFSISTDRAWHLKYKQEYEKIDTFMDVKKIKKYKNIYLWSSDNFETKKERMMHEERTQSFSIPPGISLIRESENFIDTYSFSSSIIFQDRLNILLNQSNELLDFGINFSKNINPIILNHVKKNSISINNMLINPVLPQKDIDKKDFKLSAYFHNSEKIRNEKLFTLRQIECIYCIAQGLNSSQAGVILNASKRTVESILNAAMLKVGCMNRYQLIYQSTRYGLMMEDMISPRIKLEIERELSRLSYT